MYEGIANTYLLDEENQKFIRDNNPWALQDMTGRMLEAIQRKLWEAPTEEMTSRLKELYLAAEGYLE